MNEIDAITNIIYGKMQKSLPEKDYVLRSYTGIFASGGQKSVHDIFGGAKTIREDLRPLMNADGTHQLDADGKKIFEYVPVKGVLAQSGGARYTPPAMNFYNPRGAGVGRYTPIQVTNRNTNFLDGLLRLNPNMKGLL